MAERLSRLIKPPIVVKGCRKSNVKPLGEIIAI
jgi:hypothetical protein